MLLRVQDQAERQANKGPLVRTQMWRLPGVVGGFSPSLLNTVQLTEFSVGISDGLVDRAIPRCQPGVVLLPDLGGKPVVERPPLLAVQGHLELVLGLLKLTTKESGGRDQLFRL